MSMITLFSAFMGLYVIVRLILPSGMNWPLKLILSLFALACAEKLLLTKLVYGTMGAFMPEPVQLASGYLHSAVTILFLLLRDALLLLTWPFRRSTGRQRKIFYGHKEKKPASGFWAFTLVLLALALSGYGMREALRVPPVREVRMQVPGLPDALNGFRIAQLSDLHIGPTFGKAWLTDVVARTDSLNPDLIVITGDGDAVAIGGLVQEKLSRLPKVGDHFVWGSFDGTVTRATNRRVQEVRLVSRPPEPETKKPDRRDRDKD